MKVTNEDSERQFTSQFEKWGWIKRSSHRRRRASLICAEPPSSTPGETITPITKMLSLGMNPDIKNIASISDDIKSCNAEADNASDYNGESDMLEAIIENKEEPFANPVVRPALLTQDLPLPSKLDEMRSPPLITPDGWEDNIANLSFPESDGESPIAIDPGYATLSDLSKPVLHVLLSQISMRQLTAAGSLNGTILINSIKPKTVRTLENIFKKDYATISAGQVSEEDIVELVRTSDFLFAAQSYEDSFTISRITRFLMERCSDYGRSDFQIDRSPVWLKVIINMMRSATSLEDYKNVMQILKKVRSNNEFENVKTSKDYNLLQAFLGDVLNELSDHKDSPRAAVACWIKLLAQPDQHKYPLSWYVMSATVTNIISHYSERHLPLWIYKKLQKNLNIEQTRMDFHKRDRLVATKAILVLKWCVANLSCDEFYFMVSTIDDFFWKAERHDIEIFERLVIYCYLCERLWRLEHKQRTDMIEVDEDVLGALQEISNESGLCKVNVIFSLINMCRYIVTAHPVKPTRLTLPARYRSCLETLHKKVEARVSEADPDRLVVTIKILTDHSGWPGKITSLQNQMHSLEYGWNVRVFLREFISANLELDFTKRLHQAEDNFQDGRCSTDSITFAPTARSSGMSEDYKAFKAAAKRVSDDTMASLHSSLHLPTAGLDDLTPDVSTQSKLFRYSGSVAGTSDVCKDILLETRQRQSQPMSVCTAEATGKEEDETPGDEVEVSDETREYRNDQTDAELIMEMNRMSF